MFAIENLLAQCPMRLMHLRLVFLIKLEGDLDGATLEFDDCNHLTLASVSSQHYTLPSLKKPYINRAPPIHLKCSVPEVVNYTSNRR